MNSVAKKVLLPRFNIMAGIYIHIPFCKKACHYCNFHFSTSLKSKNEILKNILHELELRKDYLEGANIKSIYFGGGTPSLLEQKDLATILEKIHAMHVVDKNTECTLEANPDDLSIQKLIELKDIGINRLSIGIQSFFEEDLLYMNRSHSNIQAHQCIQNAQQLGLENISIDLIFGYPLLTQAKWEQNIQTAIDYSIPHLSCYAMTVEPKTALASFVKQKKVAPIVPEQSASQFEYLMATLEANEFEHYEISNYAISSKRAIHNSNYWKGVSYLGIGPSAHSYNGETRQWNIANNALYSKSIEQGIVPFELEILTKQQQLNERIMISLRTKEGLSIDYLNKNLNKIQRKEFEIEFKQFLQKNWIEMQDKAITLTHQGKLFADYIASSLFV